jgi:succinyl-CoA synthetase beta subunit
MDAACNMFNVDTDEAMPVRVLLENKMSHLPQECYAGRLEQGKQKAQEFIGS